MLTIQDIAKRHIEWVKMANYLGAICRRRGSRYVFEVMRKYNSNRSHRA
jgi:hypothetical protein